MLLGFGMACPLRSVQIVPNYVTIKVSALSILGRILYISIMRRARAEISAGKPIDPLASGRSSLTVDVFRPPVNLGAPECWLLAPLHAFS